MKANQPPLRLAISLSIAILSPLAMAEEAETVIAPPSTPMLEPDSQKAGEQPAVAEEAATAEAPSDPSAPKGDEQAATAEETATTEAAASTPMPEADIKAGEEKSQVCVACHGEQGISQQDNYPHLHGQQQTYLLRQMHYFRDGGDRRDPIMTPMLENMTDQDLVNLAAYYSSFNKVLGTADYQTTPVDEKPMPTPAISNKAKNGGEIQEESVLATDEATPEPDVAVATQAATEPSSATPEPAAPAATAALVGDAAAGKTKSATCLACHGADGVGTSPLFPNLNGQKPEYLARQLKAFRDGQRQDATMAPMAMALSDQDIADLAAYYGAMK